MDFIMSHSYRCIMYFVIIHLVSLCTPSSPLVPFCLLPSLWKHPLLFLCHTYSIALSCPSHLRSPISHFPPRSRSLFHFHELHDMYVYAYIHTHTHTYMYIWDTTWAFVLKSLSYYADVTISICIHFAANILVSFFSIDEQYSIMYMCYDLYIHLLMDN